MVTRLGKVADSLCGWWNESDLIIIFKHVIYIENINVNIYFIGYDIIICT